MTPLPCPKCQQETPHHFSGTATRDSEGWTTQPMRCAICTTETKHREPPGIVYEFVGGPLDGRTSSGAEAESYYRQTSDGQIGQRFTPADASASPLYEVIQRKVLFGEIQVRAKVVGPSK